MALLTRSIPAFSLWDAYACASTTYKRQLFAQFKKEDTGNETAQREREMIVKVNIAVHKVAASNDSAKKKIYKRGQRKLGVQLENLELQGGKEAQGTDNEEMQLDGSNAKDLNSRIPDPIVQKVGRQDVLKACVGTSVGLFAAGLLISQVSHLAAEADDTMLSYQLEPWHAGVTIGLVVSISTFRQLLLKVWPDFADSSEVANRQILGPLKTTDYVIVSFLPGITEEFLFRGALLPLIGVDWKGATVIGLVFGLLHLNGGRRGAFAIWASFVGILYGLACVSTCSITVPMLAHSLNNFIGASLWHTQRKASLPQE